MSLRWCLREAVHHGHASSDAYERWYVKAVWLRPSMLRLEARAPMHHCLHRMPRLHREWHR